MRPLVCSGGAIPEGANNPMAIFVTAPLIFGVIVLCVGKLGDFLTLGFAAKGTGVNAVANLCVRWLFSYVSVLFPSVLTLSAGRKNREECG